MAAGYSLPANLNPLVDGDYLCYRCGFAADAQAGKDLFGENYKKLDKDAVKAALTQHDYLTHALANAKTVLTYVADQVVPRHDEVKVYLSGQRNFREDIATLKPYKGQRDRSFKPKYFQEIRDYLVNTWQAEIVEDIEADDAIGIEQFKNKDKSTVIVAVDKDFNCIPGWHYNWVKKEHHYRTLSEANIFFLMQMLEGDVSDNVPGIAGIGPKTTPKIVLAEGGDISRLHHRVMLEYKKVYKDNWVGAFNEVATLLWILREPDQTCPFLVLGD